MSKFGSLFYQACLILDAMLKLNVSRFELKKLNEAAGAITSYDTLYTYKKHVGYFLKWVKKRYKVSTLEEAHRYVNEYIEFMKTERKPDGTMRWKPDSQKTAVCAIVKLYGTTSSDYTTTDKRSRATRTRSRGPKPSDDNFSEANNQGIVDFVNSTGLRRRELRPFAPNKTAVVKGKEMVLNRLDRDEDGRPIIRNVRGKGGRIRDVPIITENAEAIAARIAATPDGEKVWATGVPVHMDVQSYRAKYAVRLYTDLARDPATLPRKERYDCRKDRAGEHFDRVALKAVSLALGHERISEVVQSYLRF